MRIDEFKFGDIVVMESGNKYTHPIIFLFRSCQNPSAPYVDFICTLNPDGCTVLQKSEAHNIDTGRHPTYPLDPDRPLTFRYATGIEKLQYISEAKKHNISYDFHRMELKPNVKLNYAYQ